MNKDVSYSGTFSRFQIWLIIQINTLGIHRKMAEGSKSRFQIFVTHSN